MRSKIIYFIDQSECVYVASPAQTYNHVKSDLHHYSSVVFIPI